MRCNNHVSSLPICLFGYLHPVSPTHPHSPPHIHVHTYTLYHTHTHSYTHTAADSPVMQALDTVLQQLVGLVKTRGAAVDTLETFSKSEFAVLLLGVQGGLGVQGSAGSTGSGKADSGKAGQAGSLPPLPPPAAGVGGLHLLDQAKEPEGDTWRESGCSNLSNESSVGAGGFAGVDPLADEIFERATSGTYLCVCASMCLCLCPSVSLYLCLSVSLSLHYITLLYCNASTCLPAI